MEASEAQENDEKGYKYHDKFSDKVTKESWGHAGVQAPS